MQAVACKLVQRNSYLTAAPSLKFTEVCLALPQLIAVVAAAAVVDTLIHGVLQNRKLQKHCTVGKQMFLLPFLSCCEISSLHRDLSQAVSLQNEYDFIWFEDIMCVHISCLLSLVVVVAVALLSCSS